MKLKQSLLLKAGASLLANMRMGAYNIAKRREQSRN
jgi:hypothetical protein